MTFPRKGFRKCKNCWIPNSEPLNRKIREKNRNFRKFGIQLLLACEEVLFPSFSVKVHPLVTGKFMTIQTNYFQRMESIQDRSCLWAKYCKQELLYTSTLSRLNDAAVKNQNNGQTVVDQVMIVFSTFQVAMDMGNLLEIPLILAL